MTAGRALHPSSSLATSAAQIVAPATVELTLDRVCSMGVRGVSRIVYYAVGFSGHGVALAMLAGRVLYDLYSANHEPGRDLPFYQSCSLHFLRSLAESAIYTRLTGRSPRRTS